MWKERRTCRSTRSPAWRCPTRVPQERVTHAYIDLARGLVQSGWSADGQSILLPTTADGIPALVRRLPHDPVVAGRGPAVTVWNGSGISRLAADIGAALHRDGYAVAAIGTTPRAARTHTVVVQNTLVGGVNGAAIHVLARMRHAPVLAWPDYGAHTPIVILLGSDIRTAR
jgi:hypothetical protein